MTKVSIIITSYNYEKYIGTAIESIINQTYKDWELIIVDDGSKDNSVNIIEEYCKKYNNINLYIQPENKGLIESIKLALEKANGEYVIFLESDDYLSNNYISEKLNIFSQYPNVGFIANLVQTVDNLPSKKTSIFLKKIEQYWRKHPTSHNVSDIMHLFNCVPTFSCVMLKKYLLYECNFCSPLPAFLDWWLWAQIAVKTDFYCIPQKLTYWRIHSNSYMNKSQKENLKYITQIVDFYKNLDNILPKIKSLRNKIYYFYLFIGRFFKYYIKVRVFNICKRIKARNS